MSKEQKEFNELCNKNGITNLTAGRQLFEDCFDKLRVFNEDEMFTTDLKRCRENAETVLWRKFLEGVKWETFTHEELKKVFDVVGGIIVAKEKI